MPGFAVALLDVDGTLRSHDDWKPGALDLIGSLGRAGIPIGMCSGRAVDSLRMIAADLPEIRYVVGGSGSAALRREGDGWVPLATRPLPDASIRRTLETADKHGFEAWGFTPDAWIVERVTPKVETDIAITRAQPTIAPLRETADIGKMLLLADTAEKLAHVEDLRGDPDLTIVVSGPGYIDIVHADSAATKGGDFVLADLGLSWSDALAMGDYENDIGMLSKAAVGLCMAPLTTDRLAPAASWQRRANCADLAEARAFLDALG